MMLKLDSKDRELFCCLAVVINYEMTPVHLYYKVYVVPITTGIQVIGNNIEQSDYV